MSFVQTLPVSDVPEGQMCGIGIEDTNVLLIHQGGVVYAYEDKCAHKAVALSEGILANGVLTCHAHFWQYDPTTGKTIEPAGSCIKKFPCKVENGFIFVDVD